MALTDNVFRYGIDALAADAVPNLGNKVKSSSVTRVVPRSTQDQRAYHCIYSECSPHTIMSRLARLKQRCPRCPNPPAWSVLRGVISCTIRPCAKGAKVPEWLEHFGSSGQASWTIDAGLSEAQGDVRGAE